MGMRSVLAVVGLAAALIGAPQARAEQHIFIIANNADGYGVDRCLATGASCGTRIATAYCRSQDYAQAVSFRKVEREEITGAVTAAGNSCQGSCDDFVAIECTR
jgi:hypothetical protein